MRRFWILALCAIVLLISPAMAGQNQDAKRLPEPVQSIPAKHPQILVLNSYQLGHPVPTGVNRGILTAMEEEGLSISDLFIEHLDLARMPSSEHRTKVANLLHYDLAGKLIDIVIIVGPEAIDFVVKEGQDLFPDTALLITLIMPNITALNGRPNKILDIPWRVDPAGTLKAALDLFPKTRRVVVVTGARDSILPFLEVTKKSFIPWKEKLDFEYTNEMTYEEMLQRISSLPSDAIIIYSPFFTDTSGQSFVPAEVVIQVSRTANVPVFATMEVYLGHGIVGGSLLRTETIGKQAGKAAIDYLKGNLRLVMPVTTLEAATPMMFDWNELKRWNAEDLRLPEDSIIINRPLTLWGQYKAVVITAAIGFLVMIVLIAAFLIVNRRLIRMKEALIKSEAHLRTLIRTIPDLIWLKDPQGNYLSCNHRFESFLGAKEKDIIGKNDYDFVDKELADQFRKYDNVAIAKGEPSRNEDEVTFAEDGHREILETIKTPMYRGDGQLAGVLGIGRDITERKQTEERLQQSQKLESIGTLAGGIAHDFNNILAPILGYAEFLKEDIPADSGMQSYIDEIIHAALRSKDLVTQILAVGRKDIQNIQPIRLQPIVKEVTKLLRASIPTTIEIQNEIDPRCGIVMADSTQIHQIVMNLATNAYHAMEDTGGMLNVTLKQVAITSEADSLQTLTSGNYALLSVSDTGAGIEKEILDKIFDPYFTTKGVGKGTGLGLSVVRGIVTSYKGVIDVSSVPGKGTQFSVYLPIIAHTTEHIIAEEVGSDPVGTEKILLVDDELQIVRTEQLTLERLGYRVTSCTSSSDTLEVFRANPGAFDLVLTDMTMPKMTGIQLAKELTSIRPDIPIIICTGFSKMLNDERAKSSGIKGVLMKPVVKSDMAHMLRKVLDEAKGSAQE